MKVAALTVLALASFGACAPAVEAPPPQPPMQPTAPPSSRPAVDAAPGPPVAKKDPSVTILHGQQRVDEYAWLRKKGAPEVVSYLEAENSYAAAMTKGEEGLRTTLYDEMLGRMKQDDATPPYDDGAFSYYRRFEKGKQYPMYCRKKKGDDHEIVMLDLNEIARTEKFVQIGAWVISDDGYTLVYLIDTSGFRQYTLKTKNLKTNALGSENVPRVVSAELAKDGKTLFYVTEDEQTKRSNKLLRHTLGTDSANDTLVYEEKDEMFDLTLNRTRSKAFIVATSESKTATEVRVIDTSKPASAPLLIAAREKDHEYFVDHRADTFYIRTNSGGRNFRLVTAPVADPQRKQWKELVPHRPDVMLEGISLFQGHLVAYERQDATPQIAIYDFKTRTLERLAQPEPVFNVAPGDNAEFATRALRFRYESLTTPLTYVDYDLQTKARTIVKRTEVPNYDAAAYESKRVMVPARDGTRIPVSLVAKKGAQPDGTHPIYLYAYGSYGLPSSVHFSADRVSLLDRGFVYAIAHVRGGGDMGKKWHDQGRMQNKMNTFTDFIDVTEHLQKTGWAKPRATVVAGGSAGGLLMGAVANMRPELFTVVLAYVPFVDVINTMLDETLPLTVPEFEEWGNPKNKPDFDTMIRYSPYDNVAKQAYPTMLVRTSYNDSQVMYWEPAKWVARLRANKTDTRPLLFKIAMEPAGHGGQSGRYDRLRDTAFDYAFVLDQLAAAR